MVEANADAAIAFVCLFYGVSPVLHELFQCLHGTVAKVCQNLEDAAPCLKFYLSHESPLLKAFGSKHIYY
jgi:hypothetical protein